MYQRKGTSVFTQTGYKCNNCMDHTMTFGPVPAPEKCLSCQSTDLVLEWGPHQVTQIVTVIDLASSQVAPTQV